MESIEKVVKEILGLEEQGRAVIGEAAETTAGLNEQKGEHMKELVLIDREMAVRSAPYEKVLAEIGETIKSKKAIIETKMLKAKEKTVELEIATVKMTTTKSVKILDKVGLVNALANINGGIEKGIRSFALPHIRKLMEIEAVTQDLAEFDISRRVKITAKGPNLAELAAAEKALTEEQDKEDADVKGYEEAEAAA